MRTLVLVGAAVLAGIAGAIVFFAAGKIALALDPAASESHLSAFMVAIIGVAAAVGAALAIFSRGVRWVMARLAQHHHPDSDSGLLRL